MEAYEQAVAIAREENKWQAHPNKKRTTQEIAFVPSLGGHWISEHPAADVAFNACVVHEKKDDSYYVFISTDLKKTARQIVQTYELRPEIEEDYRQIKDFWQLEDFKSTKISFITFHIVAVLIGYLFFQVYKNIEVGHKYQGRSLPVAAKKYVSEGPKIVVIYAGQFFAVFNFLEFIQLYAACSAPVKKRLNPILGKI